MVLAGNRLKATLR